MLQPQDKYSELDRDMRSERMRLTLWRGPVVPLASIGIPGAAFLALVLSEPLLAIVAAAADFLIAVLYVGTTLPSAQTFVSALRALLDKRLPASQILGAQAQAAFERTAEQFIAVAVRARSLDKKHGPSDLLHRALAAAFGMMAMQYEAAVRDGTFAGNGDIAGEVLREMEAMARLLDVMDDAPSSERAALELQIAREAEAALARVSITESQRIQRELQKEFTRLKEENGLKALRQLAAQYDLLQPLLDQKKDSDPIALAQAPTMVQQTFQEGLGALSGALTLAQAIQDTNAEDLKAELKEAEREIASLEGDPLKTERRRMAEDRRQRRLELLDHLEKQQLGFARLLDGCDKCKLALSLTRLDLADIQARRSEQYAGTVIERLKAAIAQAKAVQEEMNNLGL